MVETGPSTYKRIRSARLSLENAEQSFLDKQEMRGELDLMLAEAELKNLRRKQRFPWSWNRQLLALCIAGLVALAGAGGWYYAHYHGVQTVTAVQQVEQQVQTVSAQGQEVEQQIIVLPNTGEITINKAAQDGNQAQPSSTQLRDVDIKQLVRSARVELSNSK